MKEKTRKYLARTLCVAMSATLVAGVIGLLPHGGTSPLFTTIAHGERLREVTGQVSTDNIRLQYLNRDLVKENVFAPNARNWIMVEFGGSSLMDDFIESGAKGEFSDYVNTAAAIGKNAELQRKHKNFLKQLKSAGVEYECKYSYTTLTDAVAIRIRNKDFDEVSAMRGVHKAYYTESYARPEAIAVDNDAHAYPTGIYDSSELEGIAQGEGMVVAILDTGIDYSHKAFTQPFKDESRVAWNKDNVKALLPSTTAAARTKNINVNDVYLSEKVPFAYDYADNDTDVYPSYNNHGVHVAGIVAGRDPSKEIEVVEEGQARTFVGVAPEAQLMICKTFTDDTDSKMLGGADEIDLLAAISDCVTMGVDVINMSLGTAAGFTTPTEKNDMQQIYARVEEAGISLVVAAGNEFSSGSGGGNGTNLATNPDSGTVGSPSTYNASISVASIQGAKARYITFGDEDTAVINESVDGHGNEYDFIKQIYAAMNESNLSKPLELNYVVVGGVGRSTNYTTAVMRELNKGNTIALIKRGDITFAEKVQNAKANGALACIIYNNLSGTIRMSLGEESNPIPTCSMGMDAGERLVAAATRGVGTLTVCGDYQAGPFMSDFSAWGPTPDLKLKPEITAHGGEIVSAVPGGYDVQSGTSMASPNMAGAVALLRQYVKKNNQEMGSAALKALTNQLLMSSATMALNEDGNPYSPRKQGAGLAGIKKAIEAESYITVKTVKTQNDNGLNEYDLTGTTEAFKTSGAVDSDKVKVEFGDDKERRGVYDMTFTVHNQTNKQVSYTPAFYVMTETLASDLKTVAERAYMLNPDIRIWVGTDDNVDALTEKSRTDKINIEPNATVNVRVQVALSGQDKEYIESSFKNGMYVEGFVRLNADGESSKVDIGTPFLAFYGDWTDGPMFDYSVYDIAASEADTSVRDEDKLKATAQATQPLGLYWNDSFVIPLGAYLYDVSPFDTDIYPSEEKAAISAFDDSTLGRTIYQFYMVNAGLLRSAKTVDVTLTDTATGELIYNKTEHNISKSYAMAGTPVGAPIFLRVNPIEWGLASNKTYRLDLHASIDYDDGESPNNTFSFEFTVDTQAPMLNDYRLRYEPYTENRVTKYRVYLDVEVSDNQYVMDGMLCYLREMKGEVDEEGNPEQQLSLLTEYPIPAYSGRGEMTTLSVEITDYYEDMVNGRGIYEPSEEEKAGGTKSLIYFAVEDYAMNQSVFQFDITQARGYAEFITLNEDNKLTLLRTEEGLDAAGTRYEYNVYNLTLAPNEVYNVGVVSAPDTTVAGATYIVGGEHVLAKDRQLFALSAGGETLEVFLPVTMQVYDSNGFYVEDVVVEKLVAKINVTVSGNARPTPNPESITLKPVFNANNWLDTLNGTLQLRPGVDVDFEAELNPWYLRELAPYEFEWRSTNTNVMEITAGEGGKAKLTTKGRGTAYLEVALAGNSRIVKTIRVEVTSPYDVDNGALNNFYGKGEGGESPMSKALGDSTVKTRESGIVIIPETYNVMSIREEAFQFNEDIIELVLPSTLRQIPEEAFKGCINLEYVYIPSKCTFIGEAAFAGCTNLKVVHLGEFEDKITKEHDVGTITVGKNAFRKCESLETVIHSVRITTALDYAFSGCGKLKEIDLSGLRVAGKGVFGKAPARPYVFGWSAIDETDAAGLESVTTSRHTVFGPYMFDGCDSLVNIGEKNNNDYTLSVARIPDGTFRGCTALTSVTFGNDADNPLHVFGNTAFSESGLTDITLPYGEYAIGADAFKDCGDLETVTLSAGTHLLGIGSETFAGCGKFTAFEAANQWHTADDGILYTGSKLECIPTAYAKSTVNVLSGVTEIGTGAFEGRQITSVDLSGVTKIGAYAFENCDKLTSVTLPSTTGFVIEDGVFRNCSLLATVTNLDKATRIGARAFENCAALKAATITAASEVGDLAFANSGVESVDAPALKTVGNGAFRDAHLTGAISLPAASAIGSEALAGNAEITSLTVGPVETMGIYAFSGLTKLATFTMTGGVGEEATVIGAYAFNGATALTTVTLPASIKLIGAYAFAEGNFELDEGVRTVNIPAEARDIVIGDYAFFNCIHLAGIDLEHTSRIGIQAFAMERAVSIESEIGFKLADNNAIGASRIGAGAFAFARLSIVSIDNVEVLGSEAFTGNRLTSVYLPASFRAIDYSYDDDLTQRVNEAGRIELIEGKKVQRYGGGVFANNPNLMYISIGGDNDPATSTFFTYSNVLYSRNADGGYTLEQYPAGKTDKSFRILDGTNRIGFAAFLGAQHLETVTFPYSVRSIGSYAFFDTMRYNEQEQKYVGLTHYIFESVEAPVLEAAYTQDDDFFTDGTMYGLWMYGFYYTNFNIYGAYAMMYDVNLRISYPENGVGYDTLQYSVYFNDHVIKTAYAAERTTREAMDGMTNLPTAEDIRSEVNKEADMAAKRAKVVAISKEVVQPVRKSLNAVTNARQLAFITAEQRAKLLSAEAEIRAIKAELGIPAQMTQLLITSQPNKLYYFAGESFDKTGMVVSAVYDDLSRVDVTDYTVDKTGALTLEDESITISYGGNSVKLYISVTEAPETPAKKKGCKNAIAAEAAIIGAVVLSGACALCVVLKKKKSK